MEKAQENADAVEHIKLSLDVVVCMFADVVLEKYIPKSASRKQEVEEAKEVKKNANGSISRCFKCTT